MIFKTSSYITFHGQLFGALFLKDPGYVTIENNYKYADSYFYSLESRSKKTFHFIFDTLGNPEVFEPLMPQGKVMPT